MELILSYLLIYLFEQAGFCSRHNLLQEILLDAEEMKTNQVSRKMCSCHSPPVFPCRHFEARLDDSEPKNNIYVLDSES